MKFTFFFLLTLGLIYQETVAIAGDLKFEGSIRLRVERTGQGSLGVAKNQTGNWVTQQSRFGIKAKPKKNLEVYLQFQDARTWGGEGHSFPPPSISDTGTNASANALDMHQGFFKVNKLLVDSLSLKAGRQEIIFDDARLIGNIGWIQNGQTFDAARFSLGNKDLSLDLVASQTAAKDTHPVLTPYLAAQGNDSFFYAAHGKIKTSTGVISPFLYVADKPTRLKPGTDAKGNPNTVSVLSMQTVGFYAKQNLMGLHLKLHVASQTGQITAIKKQKASLSAVELGSFFGPVGLFVGLDQYSGDKVKGGKESNTFNALYATNHAYLGFMDKFLFTPPTGVSDTQAKVVYKSKGLGKWVIHTHNFKTAAGSYKPNEPIGNEVDVTYKVKGNGLLWQLGYSAFSPSSTINYGSTGNTSLAGTWSYLQMLTKF